NANNMITLNDYLNINTLSKSNNLDYILKQAVSNKINNERLSQLGGIEDLDPDLIWKFLKELIKDNGTGLLREYSYFLFSQRIKMPPYEQWHDRIYFDNKND